MKKRTLALLLSLVLCLASLPGTAAAGTLTPGMQAAIETYGLDSYDVETIQSHDFSNGPVRVGFDLYLFEDGSLLPIPEGYHPDGAFYEGYVAVLSDSDFSIGYMNAKGEIVIPAQYGVYEGFGDLLFFHVHDGKVWVMKEVYHPSSFGFGPEPEEAATWEVSQIDVQGNTIVPWRTIEALDTAGMHMVSESWTSSCQDCASAGPQNYLDLVSAPSVWAANELDSARTAGLIPELTGAESYQDPITRLQFAELAVNLAEKVTGQSIQPAGTDTFSDCTNEAVLKAYAAGIVSGIGGGLFAPDNDLTREQLASMLYRSWGAIGTQPTASSLDGYTDAADVSAWAAQAVGALAVSGIMKGTSDTTLSPKNSCTIEQSILLVYRLYQQF